MSIRHHTRWWSFALLGGMGTLVACRNDGIAPSNAPPANIEVAGTLSRTAVVGVSIPGALAVKVTDANGRPVVNTAVALAVTLGNGSTSPRVALTDANGLATAMWTLGTIVGVNEVTASVTGVDAQIKFEATGTAGPVSTIAFAPPSARLLVTVDSTRITAQSLDSFGNVTSPAPTFTVRDPTLVSIDSLGVIRALRRGAGTYVIATAGATRDSALVTVLAPGQSPCTAVANPVDLAIGQVVTDVSGVGFCVRGSTDSAEFALIPYYNSGVPSASAQIGVLGQGLSPLPLPSPAALYPSMTVRPVFPPLIPDDAFESRLRDRERIEAAKRMPGGVPLSARRDFLPGKATTPVVPAIGDVMKLNVNAMDFCDNPDFRLGRVVAISDRAIVVADTANPPGGFTAAEYQSIAVTFDTLVDPVDRGAFGSPTDIDNNGHVIMFFTRAVNEMTPSGANSVVLGFFYQRDLYPKTASPGPCAGSNTGELFYLMVPDAAGVVNQNPRSKAQVVSFTNGTVAHEYQHLINASRRMYVNGGGTNFEEKWLDEGLAHTAEELNFFRASGRTPRSNIDASAFNDPKFLDAFSTFELNNFRRYQTYLVLPETQSPIGFDMFDDDLPTRGAIWNFLRFAADHLAVGQENTFWYNLVNSKTSGIANLTSALGVAPNSLLRDWVVSVFLDDNAPNVDPRFQQPSWNLRSALTGSGVSLEYPLATHILSDNVVSSTTLWGNAGSFFRFSVAKGQEALLTVTSGGQTLPSTVQLAIVRVR